MGNRMGLSGEQCMITFVTGCERRASDFTDVPMQPLTVPCQNKNH